MKISQIGRLWLGLILATFLSSGLVYAQDKIVPEKRLEEKKKKDGWDFLLTPGASVSLAHNRSVIGQPEGLTMVLGVNIVSGARFRKDVHEWRASLNITELFNRSPSLDEFVKSTDAIKLETIYLFHLLDWLGPFAKLNLDTSMLEGYDVRPEVSRWQITRADGTLETHDGFRLRLTDGFEPLTLKETAGFFATILDIPEMKIEGRLGFGGQHVFADGAKSVKDDDATPEIDVATLKSYNQAGGVFELNMGGELYEKKLVYKVNAEVMMPFINELEDGDDRGVVDLTNIEFSAGLSFKVFEWLSIDYVFRAIRQPQLLDKFQIQNNLLLTASYSFFKPKEEKK
jgi:hypothetical protein